ncbi:hypothetical protein F7Q92_16375 [Ideonella dechloratans]|uniref:Uncharacterized protein n=1 Tax=Ideonella dechloratans TaxID=36863 RepID=A0A643FC91_IDEDE|nr:hypothetical protein [Ideonella dechloratans]KAB0577497.1 hypothetical protein F7Q92_16375 [Ideonella dechloratans]UFU10030.1 hypothetical protein LRM40_17300 [Ideonella dechloratans]
MQTMSTAIDRFLRIALLLLTLLPISFNCTAALHVDENRFILNQKAIEKSSYSPVLAKALKDTALISVNGEVRISDAALVILRRPSKELPLSRCGAGSEDRLALIVYSSKKLRLVDSIPLQSCENNVTLVLPDLSIPDNPADAIKLDSSELEFSTLNAEMTGPEVHRFLISPSGFKKISSPSSDVH